MCLSSTGWSTGKWLSRVTVARTMSLFPVLSHSSAGKLELIYMTTEKDFKEERGSDSGLDPYTQNWHAVTYTTFYWPTMSHRQPIFNRWRKKLHSLIEINVKQHLKGVNIRKTEGF